MNMVESEKEFAAHLESQGKTYIYQPKRFRLENTTYRTDFYCLEDNTYYEVVGTRQALSANKKKIMEFISKYHYINFKIVKTNGENYYKKKPGPLRHKEVVNFPENICKNCINECKQRKDIEIICCPQYEKRH